jgi:hypothetical protein
MKTFLFFLLIPFFSLAQTIHHEGNEILYKGDVKLTGMTAQGIIERLQNTAGAVIKQGKHHAVVQTSADKVWTWGDMKLTNEKSTSRTAHYNISFNATEGGYEYRIDSVFVTEKGRTGSHVKTGKDLFACMQVSGPSAAAAENILNEIDMNFQKILAVIEARMKKGLK